MPKRILVRIDINNVDQYGYVEKEVGTEDITVIIVHRDDDSDTPISLNENACDQLLATEDMDAALANLRLLAGESEADND